MGNISDYLKQILSARYGKDVRQSIHDSIAEINDIATGAQNSATVSASTAIAKANEAVEAAKDAAAKAEESTEAAERAEQAAQTAQEVTGITYASEDRAGIAKPKDVYVNQKDGTMEFTSRTNTGILEHSHAGGIRLHSISAVEDRQESTTGAQLFDASAVSDVTLSEYEVSGDGYKIVTKATTANTRAAIRMDELIGKSVTLKCDSVVCSDSTLAGAVARLRYVVDGVTTYASLTPSRLSVDVTFPENTTSILLQIFGNGTTTDYEEELTLEIYGLRVVHSENADLPWEKFTGNAPSPSPEYPRDIKGVVGKNFFSVDKIVATLKRISSTTVTYDGDVIILNKLSTMQERFGVAIIAPFTGEFTLTLEQTNLYACGLSVYDELPSTAEQTSVKTVTAKKGQYLVLSCVVSTDYVGEATLSNIMIRPAEIRDDTYVPYGCLRVVGKGAQLIPYPFNDTTKTTAGVTITDNGDGSLTLKGTSTSSIYFTLFKDKTPISEPCFLSGDGADYMLYAYGTDGVQYVDKGEGVYLPYGFRTVTIYINSGKTFNNEIVKPMINYGTKALPWQPYAEQIITLSEPMELHGLGNLQDTIVPQKVSKKVCKKAFGGTWVLREFAAFDGSNVFASKDFITDNLYDESLQMLCTHLIYGGTTHGVTNLSTEYGTNGYFYKYVVDSEPGTSLYICTNACSTVEELTAMMADAEFVYELAEPVETDLPTADQIALLSLKSYDGITHLYTDTYPPMVIDCEWGTSKVGAGMFEALNKADAGEIRYNELAAALLALNQE